MIREIVVSLDRSLPVKEAMKLQGIIRRALDIYFAENHVPEDDEQPETPALTLTDQDKKFLAELKVQP